MRTGKMSGSLAGGEITWDRPQMISVAPIEAANCIGQEIKVHAITNGGASTSCLGDKINVTL